MSECDRATVVRSKSHESGVGRSAKGSSMFERLFNMRLRTAERMVKDGRLDEAYRLATSPDIGQDARGPALLASLADRLIERARAHFAEERFTEAMNDLNKAQMAGGKADVIAELRKHIMTVSDEVARMDRSRRRKIEQAKQRVQGGSLAAGQQLLANVPDDVEAKKLADDIETRRRQAADEFAQVEKLLKDGQLSAAIERFRKARRLDPQAAKAMDLDARICAQAVENSRTAFEQGRINRSIDELTSLGSIGAGLPARRDLEETLEFAKRASRAMEKGEFEEARRSAQALLRLCPKTAWVKEAASHLEQVDDLMKSLFAGPLGQHAKSWRVAADVAANPGTRDLGMTMSLAKSPAVDSLPDRLLLLVDGGGSFLVVRKDRLSLGRAIAQSPPDVPIQSDLAERHAEISRVDSDYFLFSGRDLEVDGRRTRHHLLRPGNRVVLSRNAKFTFRMPHRQSPSGIIELSSSTKMPHDIRRVVLFAGTAVIGFGPTAHIACNGASRDLLMFERAGRLWVRVMAGGGVETEALPLEIGRAMEVGDISFVLQPWKAAAGASV